MIRPVGGNVGGGSGTVRYLPTYARKYISNMLFFMYDLCRLNFGFDNDRSGKGRVRLFEASCNSNSMQVSFLSWAWVLVWVG